MDLDELGHVVPDAWPADASAAVGPALKPSERSSGPAVRIPEELEVAQSAKAPVSDRSCLILVVATTDNFVLCDRSGDKNSEIVSEKGRFVERENNSRKKEILFVGVGFVILFPSFFLQVGLVAATVVACCCCC
ncbi:hypothetical protein NC652_002887 [Populus alba x Populus x berolinensis]|nr:hypothetical protein NC652_002887 [Populus alba x Populus x berolinensis]